VVERPKYLRRQTLPFRQTITQLLLGYSFVVAEAVLDSFNQNPDRPVDQGLFRAAIFVLPSLPKFPAKG
jgi:hypothetical protein